jgi:hypothetical protein
VINNAFKTFEKLFSNHYEIVNLNKLIPYNHVFKKPFGGFYINDKEIGRYAQENNCKAYLIVYYAETEMNFTFLTPIPGLNNNLFKITLIEKPIKKENGFVIHSNCSLYGYLFNSENKSIIKRSHTVLESYNSYISNGNFTESDIDTYSRFLSQITNTMFDGIK